MAISIGNHMRPSTHYGLLARVFSKFWKILKTQVQLILNSTRTHGITCLSLKGKIIRRKSHAQSIFIWEARLALRQIINEIELTNRFNEVLDF